MINYYFQMLIQFAHNNTIMFVVIVITSLLAVFILTILLLNPKKQDAVTKNINTHTNTSDTMITNQDIRAIAGDDILVTQLDLARAYIELDKIKLAKQILESVLNQGNQQQQQAAQQLLSTL